jgi:GT2 family glycosyltransferase
MNQNQPPWPTEKGQVKPQNLFENQIKQLYEEYERVTADEAWFLAKVYWSVRDRFVPVRWVSDLPYIPTDELVLLPPEKQLEFLTKEMEIIRNSKALSFFNFCLSPVKPTLKRLRRTWVWQTAQTYPIFKERAISQARHIYRTLAPYRIRITLRHLRRPEERPTANKFLLNSPKGTENSGLLQPQPGTYDVICLANIEWTARYQRPQQTMSQFVAHGHRVFYVVASQFVKPDKPEKFKAVPVTNNVFEVYLQNNLSLDFYQKAMKQPAEALFLASLEQLRQTYQIKTAVCIVHLPFWTPLALSIRQRWGWPLIYDCMDEWTDFPNIGQPLLEQEEQLVQESDIVTVTAALLEKKWAVKNKNCLLVRNGVDFNFFTQHCHPNQLLKDIAHPIIGYYGALAEWVDFELIAFLAKERPTWQFVLIGDVFVDNLAGLNKLPNVHLLGRRPYSEMPLFLYHFNVCLIPFKLNDVTHAVDPVKFYEFISAGKPVVAVPLSELQIYQEYLYLAATPAEFLAKIELAITENDLDVISRRITLAQNNDWLDRYRKMDRAIVGLYGKASIIIVTYNNVELTQLCVESIIRNTTYPNYEIILVDNHSQDGTTNYLLYLAKNHPHLKIILNNENKGFAAANNQGLKLATGDYLILLNNDTVTPKGWLTSLIKHLQDPQVGMVGPVSNFVGNEAKIDVPYKTLDKMEAFAGDYIHQHEGRVFDIDVLAMYCVAMRRDTFENIGYLDEGFGIGMFEDDDYSHRMHTKNYRVICAEDVFVHHFGQAAFKALLESGEYHKVWDTNKAYFESKWGEWQLHKHRTT